MKIDRAFDNERLMKGIIGMSTYEFKQLADDFKREMEKEKQAAYKGELKMGRRERKPGGGRTGRLKTTYEKLFSSCFILNVILHLIFRVSYLI